MGGDPIKGEIQEVLSDERIISIAQDVTQLQQTVYEMAKAEYPESAWGDSSNPIILKQRADQHSFSVSVHNRMTGGVLENLTGDPLSQSQQLPFCFRNPNASGLISKIEMDATNDLETELRYKTIEKTRTLIKHLDLTDSETKLLIIGGYLHDQGKYMEPEIKDMKKEDVHFVTMNKDENGKRKVLPNPYYKKLQAEGIGKELKDIENANPILQALGSREEQAVDHQPDLLTIYYYKTLEKKDLLTNKEEIFLEQVHSYFTWISAHRYSLTQEQIASLAQSLDDENTRLFCIALTLSVADEIAKGVVFSPPSPNTRRIEKFKNVNIMLDTFNKKLDILK